MNGKKIIPLSLLCSLLLLPPGMAGTQRDSPGEGHERHREQVGRPAPGEGQTVEVRLLDLELVNQDGKRLRFQSDVIGEKRVFMNFIYTSCTTLCPLLSTAFTQLQDLLGERLGREVVLVSLSVDPITDIPPRLKEYGRRYQARPGWTFLTGKKEDMDRVLMGLNAYSPNIVDHTTAILVGDGRKGTWKRLYGFPSPEQLMAALEELEDADHESRRHGSLRREP